MKYSMRELTPKEIVCIAGACPAIYEVTPESQRCIGGIGCPALYESRGKYLIIGKQEDPKRFREAGLSKKLSEGEVLISVPKKLIDGMKRD